MSELIIPNAPEIERSIIGSMLLSDEHNDKISYILKYGCEANMFFNSQRRELFTYLVEEYREGREVHLMELATLLHSDSSQRYGSVSEFSTCQNLDQPTTRLEQLVITLSEYKSRRDIISKTNLINRKAYSINESIHDIRSLMRDASDDSGSITTDSDGCGIKEAFVGLRTMWENARDNGGMRGIATGIHRLDNELMGLGKGELVCFSGKPSMGKSVLILQSLEPTIRAGGKVLIFTMEMQKEEVLARLLANLANVPMSKALTGHEATKHEIKMIERAAVMMNEADITIYDKGDQSIAYIESKSLAQNDKGQVDAIGIDYWQLIESPDHKDELKRLNYTSRRLKTLAKLVKAPVITGSQLNEDNKTKDSKAMIADANILVRVDDEGLVVDKSRNSARGQFIPCRLNGTYQRFE